jgi:hypothetical protein
VGHDAVLNRSSTVSETYQICGIISLRQRIINAGEVEMVRMLTNYFEWLRNTKNKPDPHFVDVLLVRKRCVVAWFG